MPPKTEQQQETTAVAYAGTFQLNEDGSFEFSGSGNVEHFAAILGKITGKVLGSKDVARENCWRENHAPGAKLSGVPA